ncbi:hypothetical protein KDK77_03750, partial [bacterium]|nr:hypothetical protein [bacterium]
GEITNVQILGKNTAGEVVATWNNLINNPVPVVVGRQSDITKIEVRVDVRSKAGKGQVFPAYIGFLTHHPGSGSVVTEISSDEFTLAPNEQTTVSFDVDVNRDGFNGYSLILFNGQKFSSSTKVVDLVGRFGHRFGILAEWINGNAAKFPAFYAEQTKEDESLIINRAGLFSGVVDSRIVIDSFSQSDFTRQNGALLAELLSQSGISEVALNGDALAQLMNASTNPSSLRNNISQFLEELSLQHISVAVTVGKQEWIQDAPSYLNVQREINDVFRYKLPFNAVVVDLAQEIDEAHPLFKEITRLANIEGYTTISLFKPTQVRVNGVDVRSIQSSAHLMAGLESGASHIELSVASIGQLTGILSNRELQFVPEQSLIERAERTNENSLQEYVRIGYPNLSRIEKLLYNFAGIKRLPEVQLGEVAAQVNLLNTPELFSPVDSTPYVAVQVQNVGNTHIGNFTAVVELTDNHTRERREVAFPIILQQGETRVLNIPIENLPVGQWRYDVSIVPDYYERARLFKPSSPLRPEGTTVQVGQWNFTAYPMTRIAGVPGERTVKFGDIEFQLIEQHGTQKIPAVRFYDTQGNPVILELADREKGVYYAIGPSKVMVNVSKTLFNEWAIEIGGEEVTIGSFRSGEEVLTIGVPHRSKVFGFIQRGLPNIALTNVAVTAEDRYIDQTASVISDVELGKEITVGEYKVQFNRTSLDDIIELKVTRPDGTVDARTFLKDSPPRSLVLGDRIFIFGNDARNNTVAVISQYVNAHVKFAITNNGNSPLRYQPEITFNHPLIGEVSVTDQNQYTILPGESKEVQTTFPIPIDILAAEKQQLNGILSSFRTIQQELNGFIAESQARIDNGELHPDTYQVQLRNRQQQYKTRIDQLLKEASQLILTVQNKHLKQETLLAEKVNLTSREQQLQESLKKIAESDPAHFADALIEAVHIVTLLKGDFGDLSTQQVGYLLSIHDLANMLGEPVFTRGLNGELGVPVIRSIIVDPVMNKSLPQQVRRIGKAEPFMIKGIYSEADINSQLNALQGSEIDLLTGLEQLFSLQESIYRVKFSDIPAAQLVKETALQNIVTARQDLSRAQTTQTVDLFASLINRLNIIDRTDPIPAAIQIMAEVQRSVDQVSSVVVSDLATGDTGRFRSQQPVSMERIGVLYRGVANSRNINELNGHIDTFMQGQSAGRIARVKQAVARIATSSDRIRPQSLAIMVTILDEMGMRNSFTIEAMARLEPLYQNNVRILPNLIQHLRTFKGQQLSRSDVSRIIERYAEKNGKEYRYYTTFVGSNLDDTIRYMQMRHDKSSGWLAAMGLIKEYMQAQDLAKDALANGQVSPLDIERAKTHYHRALGFYLQMIGVNSDFQVSSDYTAILQRVNASGLSQADKDRVKRKIEDIRSRMAEFQQFVADREKDVTAAQRQAQVQTQAATQSNELLQKLEAMRAVHEKFLGELYAANQRAVAELQDGIRTMPNDQAIDYLNQSQRLYVHYLNRFATELETVTVSKSNAQSQIETNEELIRNLYDLYQQEPVAAKKAAMENQIRALKNSVYDAQAYVAFSEWYIPKLNTEIQRVQKQIAQIQAAIRDLGGTPDRTVVTAAFDDIASSAQTARANADRLSSAEQALQTRERELLASISDIQGSLAFPFNRTDALLDTSQAQGVYQQQLLRSAQTLQGHLDELNKLITIDSRYRSGHQAVLDAIRADETIRAQLSIAPDAPLDVPQFISSVEQFTAIRAEITALREKLQGSPSLDTIKAVAERTQALYTQSQTFVRQMKLSHGTLDSPDLLVYRIQTTAPPSATGIRQYVTIKVGVLSGQSPTLVATVRDQNFNETQIDLAAQSRTVRQKLQALRESGREFSSLSVILDGWDAQITEDLDDIGTIQQAVEIERKRSAEIEPITVTIPQRITIYINGESRDIPAGPYQITGNLLSALEQVKAISRALQEPALAARLRAEGLEQVRQSLNKMYANLPAIEAGNSFVKQPGPEQHVVITVVENARRNVAIAEQLLGQARSSLQVAETAKQQAEENIRLAEAELQNARNALAQARNEVNEARVASQKQFEGLVSVMTGFDVSSIVRYQAQQQRLSARVTGGSNVRYRALIDSLTRMGRDAESALQQGNLNEFRAQYGDSVTVETDPSLAIAGLMRLRVTLYDGLFTLSWNPTNPEQLDFAMSYKLAEDGGVDLNRINAQRREAQNIISRIARQGDFNVVYQEVQQLERALASYQNSVSWVQYLQRITSQAEENRRKSQINLRRAQQFLETQQYEIARAEENLTRKEGEYRGAQDGLKQAERDAKDTITPAEAQGVFSSQGQPDVTTTGDTTLHDAGLGKEGDSVVKERIFSRILARIIYMLIGYILVLFGIDSIKRLANKKAIEREKAKLLDAASQQKAAQPGGLLRRLASYLPFRQLTVTEIIPFSGRRVLNLARNKPQFQRVARLMERWGIDTMAVVSDELKHEGKFIDVEKLSFKTLFSSEKVRSLSRKDRLIYRSRLFLRLFRSSYDDFISTGRFKMFWLLFAIVAGTVVFPVIGFPSLPLQLLSNIPLLWGGAPLFSPLFFLTPTITLPWFFWVPTLYFLPRLLYNAAVMVPVLWGIIQLLAFVGFAVFKYFFTKALYIILIPVLPLWRGLQSLSARWTNRTVPDLSDIRFLPNRIVQPIVRAYRRIAQSGRQKTPHGREFSIEFSERAIARAREWAEQNGFGPLETMARSDAQRLINSFIIEDTIKSTKHVVFQDEGNSLRVNVGDEIDDLAVSPGVFASMPAIYVPFFLPDKQHFNKWFWGILIQNFTQSLQYAASMGARSIRGAERGANAKHKIFSHIVSKSELDIHSFLFMVQPRWLMGHLHVIREELLGGRIVLDLEFTDARELEEKQAPEGVEQWNNVEDYVRYLIDRRAELPEFDAETLHQIFTQGLAIDVNFPDEMPEEDRQLIRDAIDAQMRNLVQIAAGYYRAYPDEFNPFYGPGENVTFSGHFPDVNPMDASDRFGLGTYADDPTQGVFYARGNYFGGFNYAPGGVTISGEDGNLSFAPTGEISRVEYQQKIGGTGEKVPGTKATNLNAVLLVIQGQTFLSREVVTRPDGTRELIIAFKDAHEEFLPEVAQARESFEEQSAERDAFFRRSWWNVSKKRFATIFDSTRKTFFSVNLGTRLGFEPFAGLRGILARWKTLTLGAFIGVIPVSLYGFLQDPINAAMQAYYDPLVVEKEARYEMYLNNQVYTKLHQQFSMQSEPLAGATVVLGGNRFSIPSAAELNTLERREAFALELHQIAQDAGIHIDESFFISNAELLTDSHIGLREFLLAAELTRLQIARRANGGVIRTWDKALAEQGTALVNVQGYLTQLAAIFPTDSAQNTALRYLASTIGNTDRPITIQRYDPYGDIEEREYNQNTAYQVGVFNRTSQNHIAAYNQVAALTYHGSHDDNVHRSGALERQLGDRNREPIVRLGQERNELQGTRSWAMISPTGPLNIFQMKSMAKRIRNADGNPIPRLFVRRLVDASIKNGTPIDRIIIHDGNGNPPSDNPSQWRIIVVSDSERFLMSAAQVMPLIADVLAQNEFSGIQILPQQLDVIHRDGFNTLEKFKIYTAQGNELENYDRIIENANRIVTSRIVRSIFSIKTLFGIASPSQAAAVLKSISSTIGNPQALQDRITRIEAINQTRERLRESIRRLFTIDEKNVFDKIIVSPIVFFVNHSLLLSAVGLAAFGIGPALSLLGAGIILPFATPGLGMLGLIGSGILSVYLGIGLPLMLIAGLRNYRVTVALLKELHGAKNDAAHNMLNNIPLIQKFRILPKSELAQVDEQLKIADGTSNDTFPLRSVINALRAGNPLIRPTYSETLERANMVQAALRNGVVIEPSTVDEEYVTRDTANEDYTEDIPFQEFNYNQTEIEPAVEEISNEFARRGRLLLDNLRRAATEDPHALMNSINEYITQRQRAEAPQGLEYRFEYVTLADIKALATLSRDLKNDGFIDVRTKSHRQDVRILGKIFGLNYEDALDMLSSYWSEAQWPVAVGIPFLPGTTKGRVRVAQRGGNIQDARPIPVLSALMTFAEPPWLAGLSAFNVLDTEADDPAFALAEDTKFGIMNVFNPPLYPNTPAISVHLKKYIEEQYERRTFGENSYKTAAQVGKGFSVLQGINALMSHPVFTYGADDQMRENWDILFKTVFNAKAHKRDEIAYEGAGRGSGW